MKYAYFAGGCFWCITPVFAEEDGVVSVVSGYCGGDEADPRYEDVKAQRTGHRETVRIEYDEDVIGYGRLLDIFFSCVDVEDGGGQFIDRGRSYTLAIYYQNEEEAALITQKLSILRQLHDKVCISAEPYKKFWPAEELHQDYYKKEPEKFLEELISSGRGASCPAAKRRKAKKMTEYEAITARHSVRKYKNIKIEPEKAAILNEKIKEINGKTGLNISLCLDEPGAFAAEKPSYGSFSGCRNYIVMAGAKGNDEQIGYYGESIVLLAQTLGLNTCWVALTYEKGKVAADLPDGVKIYDLIALGYGETQGVPHRSKPIEKLYRSKEPVPDWFIKGMEAAALAPTAINQQRFLFEYGSGKVSAKALLGPCSKTDLGIVKYHFEIGAGKDNFEWEDK